MKKLIQRLTDSSEFILVVTVAFGFFIAQSFFNVFGAEKTGATLLTQGYLMQMVGLEIVCGFLALYILSARGWTRAHLHLSITLRETGHGILLWLMDNCAYVIVIIFAAALFGDGLFSGSETILGDIDIWMVVLLSTLDPLYEEAFVSGYVIQALLKKHDPFFAITASAFIRLLFNFDAGPAAALFILPLGLLHGYVFWRWRRLWPLVVAHALFNVMSLALSLSG